jgi:hypothetical protein
VLLLADKMVLPFPVVALLLLLLLFDLLVIILVIGQYWCYVLGAH